MKKLFVIALAAVGMVACVNDELIETPQGNEISFDNAFIDNATRAELTAANLAEFDVWGYIDTGSEQVPLFEGETVSKTADDWTYGGGARYWAPGMQHYFQAIAPLTGAVEAVHANGKVSAINYTVDGESDLIYAAYEKVGADDGSTNGPVSFTFDHLLSKVEFQFDNGFAAEDGISIAVKNVKMTVPAEGTYDIATGEWTVEANTTKTLENIEGPKFVLPYDSSYAYAIEFDVDVIYGGVVINNVHKKSTVMVALAKGTAYNFIATINAENLNMESIDFEVDQVNGWITGGDSTLGTAAEALQAALDAAPANTTTVITLSADIEANVTDIQKPGRKVVIDGRGYKYNGTIKVHSNSEHYTDAALTIKNLNFETSTASVNFIEALENGSERYSCNITVENCTFTATGAAENTAVGVQIKSSKNAKVIGCTATNMHSLIQAQSCDESVLVQDCTVTGKNGVAFKQVKSATVEGTTITAVAYGIRFDGNTDNYGITVKDNEVTASQPFIVRKMTGKDNTIALEGENTLTVSAASISAEAPAYQIVITNGSDDEAYVKPTGTYTLTGADAYTVFPESYPVATWDEFTAALAAGETDIKLTADITYDANYQLQKSVTLNLGGYSMTLPMINIHTKTTINNGTINGKVYARKNSEIVFNNVKFSGAVADNLSTEGHLAIQGGCKSLYAKDCLFSPTSVTGSQTKPLSFEGGSTIMKFENCEFKSSPYKKQVYFNSLSATGSLDFTNCNFNNKTPNIMFAAACPLTNLTMSGTTKLSSVTLEINRAKDAVTAEDLAYLRESLIANNSMSSVRLFYAGGSSEYIR